MATCYFQRSLVYYHLLRLVTLTRFAAANNMKERFGESRASADALTRLTTSALSGRFFLSNVGRRGRKK